ncbi:AraC family transcriptional regulator [Aquimarina sp. 2201CG1-2-11]|uniref:helix-turn-helix domain-containing protein n=1 Tax=Aquimarina discodermiae TaxID=3231043 RepID=UPI003462595E
MNTISLPYDLINDELHDVCFYNYSSKGTKLNHSVNFGYHVINFLIEGTKGIVSPEKKDIIGHNHIILIRSGNCLMTETASSNGNYLSYLLFFNDLAISNFKNRFNLSSTSKTRATPTSFLTIQKDEFIANFITSLRFLSESKAIWQVKFEEFMLYLIEQQGIHLLDFFNPSTQNTTINTVIENNLMNDISLQELAFLCNMSLSSFKRRFYETYNDTPFNWIQNRRLDLVKQQLQIDNIRPSDIYLEYGFSNQSSFTQAFKKRFGITPKQYQNTSKLNF